MYEYACRHVFFPAWKMMRSRWWAGWCEKAIQQSEKMPGMRACDEEERTDRQGHATVEMPDLPAEHRRCRSAAADGRGRWRSSSHGFRGRRPGRPRNPRATRAPCASGSHGAGQSGHASPRRTRSATRSWPTARTWATAGA